MKVRNGICRWVLVFPWFVIKFPNFKYGQLYFVDGMLNNLRESRQWKTQRVFNMRKILGKVYFTAPFGIFLIMKKYDPIMRQLSEDEIRKLKITGFDNNPYNAGTDTKGNIIVMDYGNINFFVS